MPERWSAEEYRHWNATGETPMQAASRKKPGKYRNRRVVVDDIPFDSQWEATFYGRCKMRQKAGEIERVFLKVPFWLTGGVKYIIDFILLYPGGGLKFIDTKGFRTEIYKLKKKMVESRYGITIIELYADGRIMPEGEML